MPKAFSPLLSRIAVLLALSIPHILPAQNYRTAAQSGIEVLQQWYVPTTGIYTTTGWWNSANAITALADFDKLARNKPIESILANTFKNAPGKHPNFLNDYYDDEGWWALAWIDAYDATHKTPYLDMAKTIFADMTTGWDSTCNGGLWWSRKRNYKNAIPNELFLSVAAHLANRTRGKERTTYLDWATREWTWFRQSGMINAQSLINDGLTNTCANNNRTTWTYNQGVILGGLSELSKFTRSPDITTQAQQIATAAIHTLTDSANVLHESCEPKCSADAVQFKGIFIRNLALLQRARPSPDYKQFILANASSILAHDRDPTGRFGEVWSGPPSLPTAGTQSSALDAIIAAASTTH